MGCIELEWGVFVYLWGRKYVSLPFIWTVNMSLFLNFSKFRHSWIIWYTFWRSCVQKNSHVYFIPCFPYDNIIPVWVKFINFCRVHWSAQCRSVWHAQHLISSWISPFFPGTTSPCAAVFPWYLCLKKILFGHSERNWNWVFLHLCLYMITCLLEDLTSQSVLRFLSNVHRHMLQYWGIHLSPCMLLYLSPLSVLHNVFFLTWAINT